MTGVAMDTTKNLLTIGGNPCLEATHVSNSLVDPDYSSTTNTATLYLTGEENVSCELRETPPGKYRPFLHVAGRGWALVTEETVVEVVPATDSDSAHPTGSLKGGLELSISVRGLSAQDITRTNVFIGNTPCPIQHIDVGTRHVICITQPARDDGYSSVPLEDGAVGHWSLQTDYYDLGGRFEGSDGAVSYRNLGSLGAVLDAVVRGGVVRGGEGISGNDITDQAVLFNASYVEVPFHPALPGSGGFGLGLWLKLPPGAGTSSTDLGTGHYRIFADQSSFSGGVASGYLLLLNPCGQLEFWLATGQSVLGMTIAEDCPAIDDIIADCATPVACSGVSVTMATSSVDLPPGVWSIVRCESCDVTTWGFVTTGWQADDWTQCEASASPCSGQQSLHFNGVSMATLSSTHLPSPNTSLQFGGTRRIEPGHTIHATWPQSRLSSFAGLLDEVSLYPSPLSADQVTSQWEYGSTDKQRIWIRTETVDGVGDGIIPDLEYSMEWDPVFTQVRSVDWEAGSEEEMAVEEGVALLFTWTR